MDKLKINKKRFEKSLYIVYGMLVIAMVVCTFRLLFIDNSINYDEYYSVKWTMLSWKDMIHTLVLDVHPPLYYVLLKAFRCVFGYNLIFAKLFSVIAFFSILLISWIICKKKGVISGIVFLLLLLSNNFFLQKSVEVRMYVWSELFIIGCGLAMCEIVLEKDISKLKKHYTYFVLTGLLGAYTHYYTLIMVAYLYAALFVAILSGILHYRKNKEEKLKLYKKKISFFCISVLISVILYLPWFLFATLRQVSSVNNAYWISKPDSRLAPLRELFTYGSSNFTGILAQFWIYTIVFFVIVSAFYVIFGKDDNKKYGYVCLVLTFAPLFLWGMGSIYEQLTDRPILLSRYLLASVVLFYLGVALYFRAGQKSHILFRIVGIIFAFVVIISDVHTGFMSYRNLCRVVLEDKTVEFCKEVRKTVPADSTIAYMSDDYGYVKMCLEIFLPEYNFKVIDKDAYIESDADARYLLQDVRWYIETDRAAKDHSKENNNILKNGAQQKAEGNFRVEKVNLFKLDF